MERTGDPPRTRRNETREIVRCIECGGPVRLEQETERICVKCRQEPAWPQVS